MKKAFTMLLLLAPMILAEETSQVSVMVNPKTATIGDHIEIRAVVKSTESFDHVKLSFNTDQVEVIGEFSLPAKAFPKYTLYEYVKIVAIFQTGSFSLGPFEVTFFKNKSPAGSVTVEAQKVSIVSVLIEEDTDIAPLKPLMGMRGSPLYFLRYLAVILFLLLLAFFLTVVRKRKKARIEQVVPVADAEDELEMSLQELWRENFLQKGEFRPFFIRLTEIWKRFLNRHYDFPAEDFTTSETLAALISREQDKRFHKGMDLVLDTADHVKFARMVPFQTDIDAVTLTVNEMVREYQNRRKAAAEAEANASGQ